MRVCNYLQAGDCYPGPGSLSSGRGTAGAVGDQPGAEGQPWDATAATHAAGSHADAQHRPLPAAHPRQIHSAFRAGMMNTFASSLPHPHQQTLGIAALLQLTRTRYVLPAVQI